MKFSATVIAVIILLISARMSSASDNDSYIKGYASAVLERDFHVTTLPLHVENGKIFLDIEGIPSSDREKVISELLQIRGVQGVEIVGKEHEKIAERAVAAETSSQQKDAEEVSEANALQQPVKSAPEYLFEPLIADPRWPHFSMSYLQHTHGGGFNNIFSASFGETLPLYTDEASFGGQWQIAIQAAGFIAHDLDTASWDLINEDYYGGVSFLYRRDALSGLFGIYHNSSHVGDEFLLHNDADRVNLSYEAIQLKVSYDFNESLRGYLGGDYMFSPDPKDLKRWITQYGLEYYSPRTYLKGWFRPVAGADFKNRQENDWHSEISLRAGVQMNHLKTMLRRIQFMLEYYNGNSPNGQFHEEFIEYVGLGTHIYF